MKSGFLVVVFCFFCSGLQAQAPPWLWAKSIGAGAGVCVANSIATDAAGNSYVAGIFGAPSITIGSTTLSNANSSSGTYDLFVAKYSPSGSVVWARRAGGVYSDGAWGIAADSAGNCYVTGNFSNTSITFGSITLTTTTTDIFVAKYNTAGSVVWAKQSSGGAGTAMARAIAVDKSGACFVTGACSSGSVTFDTTTLSATGFGDDAFIVKYDATGRVAWAKRPSGFYTEVGHGIAVDQRGNSYVTGDTKSSSLDFGGGVSLNYSTQADRIFTVKYNSAGNAVWARTTGFYGGAESGRGITADSIGNCYVTGYSDNLLMNFDTVYLTSGGQRDAFLVKYDTAGGVAWARNIGGTSSEAAFGIAVDAGGNSYLSGEYDGATIFDTTTLANGGVIDAFVAKFDDTGEVVWARGVGGNGNENATGIALDRQGNSFVAGSYTSSSVSFGSTILSASGGGAFIAKLAACDPPLPVIVQNGTTLGTTDTFSSYQWYINGSPISGANSQTFSPTVGGTYYVVVAKSNKCMGSSNTIGVSLSVEGASGGSGVNIYPNPVSDALYVLLPLEGEGSVTIADLAGRILCRSEKSPNQGALSIDTRELPAGLYLLSYKATKGTVTLKLIKK